MSRFIYQKFDYSKLKGRIVEKCGTQANFANKIGLSERSVTLKLNGLRSFKQGDIEKITEVRELSHDDIGTYFFTAKVQN